MEWLTPEEIIEKLKISKATFFRMIKNGKIPAIKIGGQWRIPSDYMLSLEEIVKNKITNIKSMSV